MMEHVVDQYLTQSAGPTRPAVAARAYRGWLFVAAGVLLAVATGVKAYDLLANQPAPVTVAAVPLAVQYVRPDASQRGYTIVRATVGAHPPIAPGRPTIITPGRADQQTRREFRARCAVCHDPYKGR